MADAADEIDFKSMPKIEVINASLHIPKPELDYFVHVSVLVLKFPFAIAIS